VLLCLYRHPLTPDRPRLGLVRRNDIVDVHLACAVSMSDHMKPRRAHEIASSLAPPDLLSFLEGGKHSWNALCDSLVRLGRTLETRTTTAEGVPFVVPKEEAVLVPLAPAAVGWAEGASGWTVTPVPAQGSDAIVAMHSECRTYLPEYLAVIGTGVHAVEADKALDAARFLAVVRPSRPDSASVLYPMADVSSHDVDLDAVARAIARASQERTLFVGDIVRCGPELVTSTIDLRDRVNDAMTSIDLTLDIVPQR
jgi:hypothetical protein